MIASSSYYPNFIEMAIREGCETAENTFMSRNRGGIVKDKSGSCAIICILTETQAYIANVGDSRAIISKESGKVVEALSTDHKPSEPAE